MRIGIPMRRGALFAIIFAAALILLFPLRLALGGSGVAAREASGSVWSGSIKEARIGPAVLGDLDARVAPLPLLAGTLRVDLARASGAADRLTGALILGRNRRSIESAAGLVPIEPVSAMLPIASVELMDLIVRFRDGTCDHAEGTVRAVFTGDVAKLGFPNTAGGAARCDRGAVLVPLTIGPGAGGLDLRVFGDGRWEAMRGTTLIVGGHF